MLPVDVAQRALQVLDLLRNTNLVRNRIHTITSACQDVGIARSTFLRFVEADPQLRELFVTAENEGFDMLAELMINIDQIHSDAKMAAVISKNIQWFLARKKPREYGDRVSVDVTVTADKAIIGALQAAKARLPHHSGPTLELTAEPDLKDLF